MDIKTAETHDGISIFQIQIQKKKGISRWTEHKDLPPAAVKKCQPRLQCGHFLSGKIQSWFNSSPEFLRTARTRRRVVPLPDTWQTPLICVPQITISFSLFKYYADVAAVCTQGGVEWI